VVTGAHVEPASELRYTVPRKPKANNTLELPTMPKKLPA
jgi:hypothetical protein